MNKHHYSPHNMVSEEMEIVLSALEHWREAIVHFDGALNWDNPTILFSIFAFVSFIFGIYWVTEPSFLVSVGFLGIVVSTSDYFGPKILRRYVAGSWTNKKEAKYEDFCRRLVHAHDHISKGINFLMELRRDRPYTYFMLVTPLLVIFTVLGWRINNILLAYLTTVFFLLVPGLRYKGLLQIVTGRLIPFLRTSIKGSNGAPSHPPGTLDPRLSRYHNSDKSD